MNQTTIDRTRPQKLYYQLLEILKGQIEKGDWRVGTQIPTEDQLCSQYNVSKATVRLAVAELVSLGYLKKFQGKGTFVRRKKPGHSLSMLTNLGEDCIYRNPACIVRVIEKKTLQPDEGIKDCLGLAEDHCFFLSRLIVADSVPFLMQKLYIPYSLLPDFVTSEDMTDLSLYTFLESRCGLRIQRVKETVDIAGISDEDAELMELAQNTPVLRARHIGYAQGDIPVSLSEFLYRTDVCPKTTELERLRI